METYILEWLSLLLRWSHFVVGIAWIGSSFYFVWLDTNLNQPPKDPESDRVAGDLWSVHGGGFYHSQKYLVSPAKLPEPLHWFKWEAYTTWLTGFALLVVTYYWNAQTYLVDASVRELTPTAAVLISIALLILGWVVYDALCRLPLKGATFTFVGVSVLAAAALGLSQLFSGRGMYMQLGAMLGTIMAANVAMVIIPGQRKMVDAMERGETPDPEPGLKAKQRSLHNNYFTLPVLFVMISSHYPMTYGHQGAWLILITLFLVGGAVRHYFNLRNQGRNVLAIPVFALAALLALAGLIAPRPRTVSGTVIGSADMATIQTIVALRCQSCHSANPTHPTAPVAPNGVMLDTPDQIHQWADQIYQQTVETRVMPLANLTAITEEERTTIAVWYQNRD
ncbi:MAG: urate hydroxylase PuuD [Pseudomonadota bacterium]